MIMEKIKVLHVLGSLNQGGIENLIMSVYRKIDRSKIQFEFAVMHKENDFFSSEIQNLGGKVHFFDSDELSIKCFNRNLSRIINNEGPFEAVHSHSYFFSGVILFIAKMNKVEVRIAHAHDTEKGREKTLYRRMYEFSMRKMIHFFATDMIGCSKEACEFVFGKKSNYQIIYNGIDMERFAFNHEEREIIRKKENLGDCNVFLHVGRFADQKNHEFILNVFHEHLKKEPNDKLLLIGSGVLEDKIKKKVKELNMENNVLLLGNKFDTEKYYSASDCFLLPSKYEGLGIVLVEAQASGLKSFVSTKVTKEVKCTDLLEYLPLDQGINPWVEKIKDIHKNSNREIYVKELIGSDFDIDSTISKLTCIYTSKVL